MLGTSVSTDRFRLFAARIVGLLLLDRAGLTSGRLNTFTFSGVEK